MYDNKKQGKTDFAGIYHDLEELSKLLKGMETNSGDPSTNHNRKQMEYTLQNLKNQMITSVVEDVVNDLRQAGDFNFNKDEAGFNKELQNKTLTEKVFTEQALTTEAKNDITLQEAGRLIEEVKKEAILMGIPVVIAVYNRAAHPVAIQCMDDSYIASYDVAVNKAYTCAALKMSTSALKTLSQPGGPLYGIQHTNQGRIVIFGGGEPLIYKNKLIGALGVSGGTEEQDTKLAEIGRNKLEEVMTW